jgi:hypothetical protein
MARRKAQTYGSAILDHGGRLSARHMCSSSKAVAHVICDVGRQQAPLLPEVGFAASERQLAPSRTSYWVRENPATAREADRASAGPHAPHLVPPSQRLARAPVNWTRCVQFKRSLEGGDKLARPSRSFPSSRPCAGHPRHPGLVPGIHDLAALPPANRGWPGHDKSTGANYWRMRRAPRGSTRT